MNDTMIEAAGWTMLHFLWQGALVGAVFGLIRTIVRKRPQVRYLAGCFALLTMPGIVATTFASQYETISERETVIVLTEVEVPITPHAPLVFTRCRPCHATQSADTDATIVVFSNPETSCFTQAFAKNAPAIDAESPSGEVAAADPVTEESGAAPSLFSWLVGSWVLGVALLALRFFISWGATQRLRSGGITTTPPFLTQCLNRVAHQVGVRRPLHVLVSAAVTVPSVIGWLRPIVLLPVASMAGLSRTQLEAVLAHELAHVRRHDYLVNLMQHAVETLFFFHPVVWWVSKKVREEREYCCDDIAAQTAGNPLDYARALATLEEQRSGQMILGMAANGGSLHSRIRRLCGVERPQPLSATVFPFLLLFLAAAIPLATVSSQEPTKPKAVPAKAETPTLTSEEGAKGLRHLLKKTPEPNIPFSDFVMLARPLDETSLVTLLGEIGMRRSDGYRAWTRSALYAEWARRDLDSALDHYRRTFKNYRGIREQVAHALYVGSRPKDPWAALAYLRTIPNDPRFQFNFEVNKRKAPMVYTNADWVEESYKRLFKELATLDAERAWKELPGRAGSNKKPLNQNKLLNTHYPYDGMVDGFFSGLKDRQVFENFVQRFGPVGEPGTEPIAIVIAKEWMRHDIAAAQAWAPPQRPINPLGAAVLINGVDGNAAIYWARENPKAALEAIRNNVLPKWNFAMAEALLEGDPSLAGELVAVVDEDRMTPPATKMFHSMGPEGKLVEVTPPIVVPPKKKTPPGVWYILRNSMRENAELQDRDAFPEPGRSNRLLDHRARYDSYRAAIASKVFSEEERTNLRAHLDALFDKFLNPPPNPK